MEVKAEELFIEHLDIGDEFEWCALQSFLEAFIKSFSKLDDDAEKMFSKPSKKIRLKAIHFENWFCEAAVVGLTDCDLPWLCEKYHVNLSFDIPKQIGTNSKSPNMFYRVSLFGVYQMILKMVFRNKYFHHVSPRVKQFMQFSVVIVFFSLISFA